MREHIETLIAALGDAVRPGGRAIVRVEPRRRRPREAGTFDSAMRKSVMSEMPFWIVSGVMPCSSL